MKKGIGIALLLLFAVSALFTGCRRGSPGTTGSAATEMVINNGTNIQSLDPTQITGVPEHRIYMALFEGLVTYDLDANVIPGVAESWTYNSDRTVITFNLRQGITWSDGTAITAGQIVDSWLHHLDPATASEYAYMIGYVVKGAEEYNSGTGSPDDVAIRAVDDRTFEVTLIGPTPYAVDMMAHYAFSPLPMHVIQSHGTAWTRPENFAGNGPFVLSEYVPNNRIVVVPNTAYWNRANVHLTKITFLPIEDLNTSYNAFLGGEIDWDTDVPLARIDEVKLHKDYQVAPQVGTYYLLVNNRNHPALADSRVRRALSMAIDRDELINNVVKGGQIPALSLVPPMGDYAPAAGNGFNVTEAKRLLAEAGYPDGHGLPAFEYIYNTLDTHRIIGEYIQQAWRNNLGVNIQLQNMEWASYLDYRSTGQFQIARAGWVSDYMDPQDLLNLLVSDSGNNDGKYSDAEYDRIARRTGVIDNSPERTGLMRQAEDIGITRDQAVIPIYFYVSQSMINLDIWEGWHKNPMDAHTYVGLRRR
ncbi:MAG: peptide ABC transporter substrate-binding protein [Treponema sp.]|nr:peptide ABC transporter substrate-binding protein [Treponema sp.]